MQTFGFNLVINEDAGLNVAHHFTAGKLVGKVRREGGTGCFIALGLPNSGKTYMMEVSVSMHLLEPPQPVFRTPAHQGTHYSVKLSKPGLKRNRFRGRNACATALRSAVLLG